MRSHRSSTTFVLLLALSLCASAQDSVNVTRVGSLYNFWEYVHDVSIRGDYAYCAAMESGLHIVDISRRDQLIEVGSFSESENITKVEVSGNYAYLACGKDGLRILDVSNPANIVEVGYYDSPYYTSDVAVSGGYVHTADRYKFYSYDCSAALGASAPVIPQPSSFSLSCFPNPFNPGTRISFSLPQASQASLRVFDVLGREIALLHEGFLEAGEHHVAFDGSTLASGIYFAQLTAGSTDLTQKLILIK